MATYASFLRKSGVDGGTIRLNAEGRLSAGGIMEPFSAGTKGGAPSVFYVDGNVVSSGNGLSWLSAVKTLAEGLAMAHAYMSTSGNRAWAQRATVYCCGDDLTEDLVILAEKTDVVGVGTSSGWDMCGLIGNHVPVTTNTWACRFYNIHFSATTAGIIWDLTAPSHGIKFIDCEFEGRGPAHTHAIRATVVQQMEIAGCRWYAARSTFSTAAIAIGAGNSFGLYIHNNFIVGKVGIVFDSSTVATAGNMIIDNNIIASSTLCIDDEADVALISNNTFFSDAACGASGGTIGNCIDVTDPKTCNNFLSGSDGNVMLPGTDMEW